MATASTTLTLRFEQIAPYYDGLALYRLSVLRADGSAVGSWLLLGLMDYERYQN